MFLKLCFRFVFFATLLYPALLRAEIGASGNETLSITKQIPQRWLIEVKDIDNGSYRDSLRNFISTYNPGGLIYHPKFGLSSIETHLKEMQRLALTPLLIGLDISGYQGADGKLPFLSPWLALAATQDSVLVTEFARADAFRLKEAGIHMLMIDPFRLSFTSGFGQRPAEAKASASAYIAGLRSAGINVVIKPGGHESRLPLKEELETISDLRISGLDTYAMGLAAPEAKDSKNMRRLLKANEHEPFTISKWPDSRGLDEDMKRPQSDFLVLSSLEEAKSAFERRIHRRRQAMTVLKIAQWKLTEMVRANIQIAPYESQPGNEGRLARESSMLLSNSDSLLPFRSIGTKSFAASFFGDQQGDGFYSMLDKYVPLTRYKWDSDLQSFRENESRINHFSVYIAAVDLHWFSGLPQEEQLQFQAMLIRIQEQNTRVVAVLFGDVEMLPSFASIQNISYHPYLAEESFVMAPQLLFGAYSYTGRWLGPAEQYSDSHTTTTLARLRYGDPWMQSLNIAKLSQIDSLVKDAILDKAIPGCQVLVAKGGTVVYEKSFGYLSYDSLMPVTENTLYDLASLTKVTATLQMMMKLVENGEIDINASLGAYLSETVGTNKENLVISDILLHRAGLRPYIPFWEFTYENRKKSILSPNLYHSAAAEEFPNEVQPGMYTSTSMRDSVWYWTIKSDLMELPHGKDRYSYKYSDLGFIIIQRLVEQVGQTSLDQYVSAQLYKPLGLEQLCFQPLCEYSYEDIAPTELDYYFRKDMIWGNVHDQNAALMGGVAGHAGLFGSSNSLAVLLQMHLQKGYYGGQTFFQPETIELFTRRKVETDLRAFGWDLKDITNERKNVSFLSSETTYGHTGFTGTAAWVDPAEELIFIFLSNRVHPDANNYKLVESNLRTRIQDVIYQSFEVPAVKQASNSADGKLTSGD